MAFEELFDGEEHWLGVDADPGWTVPFLASGALVRVEGWKGDELETADPGLVMVEPPKPDPKQESPPVTEAGRDHPTTCTFGTSGVDFGIIACCTRCARPISWRSPAERMASC